MRFNLVFAHTQGVQLMRWASFQQFPFWLLKLLSMLLAAVFVAEEIHIPQLLIGLLLLFALSYPALNDQHGVENEYLSYYYCYVVKPGVFAVAAVLCITSVALGIMYYLTISSGKDNPFGGPTAPNQSGIAMGQAQVPPTSRDPVFVHEDTYARRQFT
ncbi:Na(+)/H(+) antiporter NhaA 1 [Bienertia sinuspersici]